MLTLINPIKEAEENILKENIIKDNFYLSRNEVQDLPIKMMKYLINLLIKRNEKEKFEKMVIKNS